MTESFPDTFFVLGHPRSGTTALAELLNASDNIACIFYEGNLIYRLHRTLSRHKVLEEPKSDLIADFEVTARHNLISRPRKAGAVKPVFREEAVAALVNGFTEDLSRFKDTEAIFRGTSERFFTLLRETGDFIALGDKVPDYINIPGALQAVFPAARFIYIKRDPRAIVHSVMGFIKKDLHLFAASNALATAFAWVLHHKGMAEFSPGTEGDSLLVIKQEDLRADPLLTAEKVFNFLGVFVDAPLRQYAEKISKSDRIKDWRSGMPPEDIKAVESAVFESGLCAEMPSFSEDRKDRAWSEKALAVTSLIHCRTKEIHDAIQIAEKLFTEQQELESLGLTLLQFADWYHVKGEYDRARLIFPEACRLHPENPVLTYKFGEFCFDTKNLESAKSLFKKVLELCPETEYYRFLKAKTFYHLGRIERLTGRKSRAEGLFKKSLHTFRSFGLPLAMLQAMADSRAAAG